MPSLIRRVRFQLVLDNRTHFQSTGSGDVREVLCSVYGVDVARQMIELGSVYDPPPSSAAPPDDDDALLLHDRAARDAIVVSGFISPPALNRSNRKEITLFVNGRWVQDIRLSTAVLQAYHTMLMVGRYPIAVVCSACRPKTWMSTSTRPRPRCVFAIPTPPSRRSSAPCARPSPPTPPSRTSRRANGPWAAMSAAPAGVHHRLGRLRRR